MLLYIASCCAMLLYVAPCCVPRAVCRAPLTAVLTDYSHHKQSRDRAVASVRRDAVAQLAPQFPAHPIALLDDSFNQLFKALFRRLILDSDIRWVPVSSVEIT